MAIDPLCKPEDTAALLAAFERDVPGMKQYVAVSDAVCERKRRGWGWGGAWLLMESARDDAHILIRPAIESIDLTDAPHRLAHTHKILDT